MGKVLKYFFFFPIAFVVLFGSAQDQARLKFFLTVDDGLSHNEVTAIVQDKDGFIWIGTRGGLNRYDGYEFKVFNQVPGDSNSLVNPSIESLFVDSKGNIWIGTKSGGVSKYNPVTGVFNNIVSNYKHDNPLLPDNRVLCFHEDRKGQIWMGTWESGVIVYNEEKGTSKNYLSGSHVNTILETQEGEIWVGNNSRLFQYIQSQDQMLGFDTGSIQEMVYDENLNALWMVQGNSSGFRKFDFRNHGLSQFKVQESMVEMPDINYPFESILNDSEDNIWLGTWGTGLFVFDKQKEQFSSYNISPENQATLNKDYDVVLDIFEDSDGNIWLGTNGGGICVLTPKLMFNSVGFNSEPNKGLINTRIMSVVEDHKNNLLLGTIGSGLIWSPDKENFYPVQYPPEIDPSGFFVIKNLFEDNNGVVWAGTGPETYYIRFENGIPKMINAENEFQQTFPPQAVSFLNAFDMLWVGTLQLGLYLYDYYDNYQLIKTLTKNDENSGDLHSNRISDLLQDSKGRVWLGTYNGLHVYNHKDTTVSLVENAYEIKGDFTGNIITSLEEDQKGNIWIGTPNGLNKLSEKDGIFTVDYYTENDGLASNFIKGISFDLNGNIWISTNVGISKFYTKESRFINFDETDGVLGKNFTEASVYRNEKLGLIYFGGTDGFTWFSPEDIHEYEESPKPIFTGVAVLNQPVEPGKPLDSEIILTKSITHTDELELSYRQNNFEIEFSALDYKSMGRNKYKYLLENQDEEWNYIGKRRQVFFNNLHPGDYVLKIKSANSHNVWSETATELAISVAPPFWQTWYAIIFYVLLLIGIVLIIRRNAVKQVQLSKNLEMEKMQHAQNQRISEMKFQFFTNISHEFRTPLTLILAPIKEILRNDSVKELPEMQHKLNVVQRNVDRLMGLISQLLDFRKAESGKMKLSARYSDIESFVEEVCFPFEELARINNIDFKTHSKLKTKHLWFDREKLEIILNNLISNAFKFVKEKGEIRISLFEEEEEILISIRDNGPGINRADLKHIFDRFYNVEKDRNYTSSGIGLALVKRLVEMHRGNVSVTSQPNKNTEFVVALPKGKVHLNPEEITEIPEVEKETSFIRKVSSLSAIMPSMFKKKSTSGAVILIVEDNIEMQNYIQSLLSPYYRVETAANGADGFEKALEVKPNMIISDVMMPKVDGFEFCKKIKEHQDLATVPFIMLTAKSAEQFKLMGAKHGADVYISKPFDPHFLLQNVKNLIIRQEKMQLQYSKTIRLEPSDIEITTSEEVFIKNVISTIEKNLQSPDFSSEVLASELNMSGSSLYRKLKTVTDTSTAEFIRTIRIKRAAQLLADKQLTITEIAYDVGFNDLKHFRTVFQKHFGCSPTEYREKL